jgi:hypothetical protein
MKFEFSFLGFLGGMLLACIFGFVLHLLTEVSFFYCFLVGLFGVVVNGFLSFKD